MSDQTSNLVVAARELLRLKDLKTDAEAIVTSGDWAAVRRQRAMLEEHDAKKGEAWDALRRALQDETNALKTGMDTAWPLFDVLAKLIEATEHLLDHHACDTHGHEEFRGAATRGKEYLALLHSSVETNGEQRAMIAGAQLVGHTKNCALVRGAAAVQCTCARPRSEWHEDMGAVLWWFFPIVEPPYVGTPNDSDWPLQYDADIDDPGEGFDLCTHWTPIPVPQSPLKTSGPAPRTTLEGQERGIYQVEREKLFAWDAPVDDENKYVHVQVLTDFALKRDIKP